MLVLVLVAVGCGLFGLALVNNARRGSAVQMQQVLVAKADLPAGTRIDDVDDYFVIRSIPRGGMSGLIDAGNANETAQLVDTKLTVAIPKGGILSKEDVQTVLSVTSDMDGVRAMTIPIRLDSASSFIVPGSRVDLITTINREARGVVAQIFLQDVKVLAINRDELTYDGGNVAKISTAVLAVPKVNVGRLLLAKRLGGDIVMALRRSGDNLIEKDPNKLNAYRDRLPLREETEEKTEKILVARRDIPAYTRVENVADLFEEKEVPEKNYDGAIFVQDFQDKALTAEGQKVVAVALRAGTPLARSFIIKIEPLPEPGPPEPARHKLTIINGKTEQEIFLKPPPK
jgi:Flp pilus assembly protein CpaB